MFKTATIVCYIDIADNKHGGGYKFKTEDLQRRCLHPNNKEVAYKKKAKGKESGT